jgi:SAM-dependent methyltransferase
MSSSSEALLDEVWRVLKPGGLAYLACPNRYSLVEPHYRLPFLSWFPVRWLTFMFGWQDVAKNIWTGFPVTGNSSDGHGVFL